MEVTCVINDVKRNRYVQVFEFDSHPVKGAVYYDTENDIQFSADNIMCSLPDNKWSLYSNSPSSVNENSIGWKKTWMKS